MPRPGGRHTDPRATDRGTRPQRYPEGVAVTGHGRAHRGAPCLTDLAANNRGLREEKPLGTAGGLAALKGRIGEPFIFLYGDAAPSMDFRRMLAFHEAAKAAITLLAHPNSHPYDSDLLLVGPCDTLVGITRKGEARLFDYSNLVNAGAYIVSRGAESVEAGIKQDFEKDILPRFLAGGRARAYRTPEFVKDMGTPERLAEVEAAILSGAVEARRLSFPQKAIFLDRDGTINRYVDLLCRPEQIELLPGSAQAIRAINESGYLCFVVSNQPVVARGCVDGRCRGDAPADGDSPGRPGRLRGRYPLLPAPSRLGLSRGGAGVQDRLRVPKAQAGHDPGPGCALYARLFRSFMVGDTSSDVIMVRRTRGFGRCSSGAECGSRSRNTWLRRT